MNNFTCALSGQTPISDPVALPTGQICSKKLLLTKLHETSNRNPFQPDSPLDESQLISLGHGHAGTSQPIPPLQPTQNSIPSLLQTISSEYDALILELFDTRKALQETKEELTHALYQNDAAVRVIARVVMERDMARKELAQWKVSDRSERVQEDEVVAVGKNKRKRLTEDEVTTADVVEDSEARGHAENSAESEMMQVSKGGIPEEIKKELKDRWTALSSERKAKTKGGEGYALFEDIQSFSAEKKTYHKTSAKGILAMTGGGDGDFEKNDKIITSSTDKQLTIYDWNKGKVQNQLGAKVVAGGAGMLDCAGNTVAMVDATGGIKMLVGKKFVESIEQEGAMCGGIKDAVGVKVHPTGKHVFVAEKSGYIHLMEVDTNDCTMKEATCWNGLEGENDAISCTSIGLHPDGLILAIGRSDGKIGLWDLNTEKLATTLGESKDTPSPITVMDFSEKGVHLASVDAAGNIIVWDLRKQKSIFSTSVPEGVSCVSFCPIGKYFAYGTFKGHVTVTAVKDWEKNVALSEEGDEGAISGLLWGKEAKSIVVTSTANRLVKIWGLSK